MTSNHILLYRLAELMLEHEQHLLPVDLLFDDEQIGDFVKSIQIDSPYQQMLLEGVLTESVKDENLYVGFTVEGYFHFVLGEVIESKAIINGFDNTVTDVINNKLKGIKDGFVEYLIKKVTREGIDQVIKFIDKYEEYFELALKPLASSFFILDNDLLLAKLLENPTDNDIELLAQLLGYFKTTKPEKENDLKIKISSFWKFSDNEKMKLLLLDAASCLPINELERLSFNDIHSGIISNEFIINNEKIYLNRKVNNFQIVNQFIENNKTIITNQIDEINSKDIRLFYDRVSFYYSEIGEYNKALNASSEALSFLDSNDVEQGVYKNNLALKYIELQRFEEAKKYLNEALSFDIKMYGRFSINAASRFGNLGLLLIEISDYESAHHYLLKAIEIDEKLLNKTHENLATRFLNLSECLRNLKRNEEAIVYLLKSREIDLINYGEYHPMLAYSHNIEAHIHLQNKDHKKALDSLSKSIYINMQFQNGINDRLNRDYNFEGIIYFDLNDFEHAKTSFLNADKIENQLFIGNPELRVKTWLNLCKVLKKIEDQELFNQYFKMLINLPNQFIEEYNEDIAKLKN